MHLHVNLRNWARLAVSAALLGGSSLAHAQPDPAGAIPPGWVFQGTWHDGHWDGQWVPGGAPGMMPPPQGPMQGPGYAPVADRDAQRMIERCHRHHHDRDCERFHHDRPEYAPGYAMQGGYGAPYGAPPMGPYGTMPYAPAPMGYMMMPVIQPAPAPYTETKTVTTTYVTDSVVHHSHVTHTKLHRDKRVYTGS